MLKSQSQNMFPYFKYSKGNIMESGYFSQKSLQFKHTYFAFYVRGLPFKHQMYKFIKQWKYFTCGCPFNVQWSCFSCQQNWNYNETAFSSSNKRGGRNYFMNNKRSLTRITKTTEYSMVKRKRQVKMRWCLLDGSFYFTYIYG